MKWENTGLITKSLSYILPSFICFLIEAQTQDLLITFFFISTQERLTYMKKVILVLWNQVEVCVWEKAWGSVIHKDAKHTLIPLLLFMEYKFKVCHNRHIGEFHYVHLSFFVHLAVMCCCCSQIPSVDQSPLFTMLQCVQENTTRNIAIKWSLIPIIYPIHFPQPSLKPLEPLQMRHLS